jgi:hypothetical protein
MAKYKLVDLILERKDFIIKLSDGNDFIESFYDEKAVKSKYPISKVVNSATVIDITTPSGTSIISDKEKMTEVIGAFGEKTKQKLSAKSAESLEKMLGGKSFMQASQDSMRLLQDVMQLEKPYRDQLTELAKDIVDRMFPVLKQAGIEVDAAIVDTPSEMKITKEKDEEEIDTEEEANIALDTIADKTDIDKRRIINSITQGAGIRGTKAYYIFDDAMDILDSLGVKDKYEELVNNAYGIYDDDNAIAMMMAMLAQGGSTQGGESEIDWNEEEDTMTIKARALTFPILMQEIVKGLYEFVALQGFTDVAKGKGQAVVKATDKVTNEPEDIRYGKFIYDGLRDLVNDNADNPDAVRELFFAEVYKLNNPYFKIFIENMINDELTSDQKGWVERTLQQLEDENK